MQRTGAGQKTDITDMVDNSSGKCLFPLRRTLRSFSVAAVTQTSDM